MPKIITRFFFRMFLRTARGRRWRNWVTGADMLAGAPADDEKLHSWFKQAFKWWIWHFIKSHTPSKLQFQTVTTRFRVWPMAPVRPTRKFVIALPDVPLSMQAAERCIQSAKQYGEDHGLETVPAINKFDSEDFFVQHGLTWTTRMSVHEQSSAMGCFSSHFKLWLRCVELGEPIVILEHDAAFCAPIPRLKFKHVIMLGQPSSPEEYQKHIGQSRIREGREIFHPWNHLLGTHGYAITPEGAHKLLETARRELLPPVDHFICKRHVDILYYHPFPISLDARFSSITKTSRYGPGHE